MFDKLMDSASLYLTSNTSTLCTTVILDLHRRHRSRLARQGRGWQIPLSFARLRRRRSRGYFVVKTKAPQLGVLRASIAGIHKKFTIPEHIGVYIKLVLNNFREMHGICHDITIVAH
jgi:hypothetical protein